MAAARRRDRTPVACRLLAEPSRFDFFQAVRLLEWLARQEARMGARPAGYAVGEDHAPQHEAVRFRAIPALGFPAGPIAALAPPPAEPEGPPRPVEMSVAALGLTGPSGALPAHYTALMIERIRAKDFTLRDFLDLFHHRIASLFYRAWEKYRFPIAYEGVERTGQPEEDRFTQALYALVGLGTPGLRGRLSVDDEAVLFFGGYYAHWPRNAQSLERLLADYFEVPVEVRQFHGAWLYLAEEDQSCLPGKGHSGRNHCLGRTLLAGSRVWDVENRFRIRLGPLGYAEFCRFLPSGDALRRLAELTRLYVGPQFDFDVQLVLRAEEVPWCRLGDRADPPRLGWTTWVRARAFSHDVDDPVFTLEV